MSQVAGATFTPHYLSLHSDHSCPHDSHVKHRLNAEHSSLSKYTTSSESHAGQFSSSASNCIYIVLLSVFRQLFAFGITRSELRGSSEHSDHNEAVDCTNASVSISVTRVYKWRSSHTSFVYELVTVIDSSFIHSIVNEISRVIAVRSFCYVTNGVY